MKLIIASNNKGKIAEFRQILSPLGFDVVSLGDAGIDIEVDETGSTFAENAALKARAVYKITGCATLADDSGLEVDALGGEPGVYSARYGGDECKTGDDRNRLILKKLSGVPDEKRTARFVAVIHFISDTGSEITVSGVCEGKIGYKPVGNNGFGYDPIFVYGDRTFAEHPQEVKNAVSHRARALQRLVELLSEE